MRWDDPITMAAEEQRNEPCSSMQQEICIRAEFGLIDGDRRHRLVMLYSDAGKYCHPVLIPEFRAETSAMERPPLGIEQLPGTCTGRRPRSRQIGPRLRCGTANARMRPPIWRVCVTCLMVFSCV